MLFTDYLFKRKYSLNLLYPFLLPIVFLQLSCSTNNRVISKIQVQKIVGDGVQQYKLMMTLLPPPDNFPKSFNEKTNKLEVGKETDWVSGFYPGTLLYLYKATGDTLLRKEAERIMVPLAKEQFDTTIHDLGFMM